MNKRMSRDLIEPLVIGGGILGGGGGGAMEDGRRLASLAFDLGTPEIISFEELNDEGLVVIVSAVGAPASKDKFVMPIDYSNAVQKLSKVTDINPIALMSNENGGIATVNGLLQSAILGIPVVDAACNGRAHPTGTMGSMKLTEIDDYRSAQVAIGGEPGSNQRIELVVEGSYKSMAQMVRDAAIHAGGLMAVARTPVSANFISENGAIGAISQAIEVGIACIDGKTPMDRVENVANVLKASKIKQGYVEQFELKTINGFDLGRLVVEGNDNKFELTFWNEYMTIESDNKRIATFPDLIMTFNAETGLPVTSAQLRERLEVIVIVVPYQNLILGGGMVVESNYNIVEKVLNKDLKTYIKPLFE